MREAAAALDTKAAEAAAQAAEHAAVQARAKELETAMEGLQSLTRKLQARSVCSQVLERRENI